MAFTYSRRWSGPAQAVIFDMAGTVMDFGSRAPAGVFVEVFARNGVELSIAEARGPMGAEMHTHIAELLALPAVGARWAQRYGAKPADEDIDRLYAEFIPLQVASLPAYAELVPGMPDTAAELRRRGLKLAANSGYNREMLEVCLAAAERQGLRFDSAVAASVLRSSQAGTFSCRPGSADIVNAGITRPAITHSIVTIKARPACSARRGSMLNHPSVAA